MLQKIAMVLAVIALAGCGRADNRTLDERYPGPWQERFHAEISKALASKHIRDCGEYKYRESADAKGEYLVGCTADGVNWSMYIVWSASGAVMGPYSR